MDAKPHGRDLRKGRLSETGRVYLVTTATYRREPLFSEWHQGRIVVHAIAGDRDRADTLAYVVMPDHFHWLLQLAQGSRLEQLVQAVKSVSAHRLNRQLGRRGPVWQAGFHDHALRREEDIVTVARYVVTNPLRAGLVQRLGDYPLWDARWI